MFSRDNLIEAVRDSANNGKLLLNPIHSRTIISNLWHKMSKFEFHAYGSTSDRLVAGLSVYNSSLPLREHQTFVILKSDIFGSLRKESDCILVEFSVESPEILMNSVKCLQKSGHTVKSVICILDTFNNVGETLKANKIEYLPMLTKTDLENCYEAILD